MRFILVLLLAVTSTLSLAQQNEQDIDYQQALSDYQQAITQLKAARATIMEESEAAAKESAKIDALLAQSEAELKTTIQGLVNEYQTRQKQLEEAHAKRLESSSELADLSLQSIQQAEQELKAKYEVELKKTTQALVSEYQNRLQQLDEAYTKRLGSASELADLSLKSVRQIEQELKAKYEAQLKKTVQALVNEYQTRLQKLEAAYTKRLSSTSDLADLSLKSIQQIQQQIEAPLAELKKTSQALVKDYQTQQERFEEFYIEKLIEISELTDLSLKSTQLAEQKIKTLSEQVSAVQSAPAEQINALSEELNAVQSAQAEQINALSEELNAVQSAQAEQINALSEQLNTVQSAQAEQINALSEELNAVQSAQSEQINALLYELNAVKLAQAAVLEIKAHSEKLKNSFLTAQVVFNSVGNEQGANAKGDANTLTFWQIPYQERFNVKGNPALVSNYYNPTHYQNGPATYIDVVEDLEGNVAMLMTATADGIDSKTVRMINPKLIEGNKTVYQYQFASGWSSSDYDGDDYGRNNFATQFGKVTQHYGSSWYYSLGADADSPVDDDHWGPHIHSSTAQSLNLKTDDSSYTRVRRITRYVIF